MPALIFIHHSVDLVNCALKTAPFAPLTLGWSILSTAQTDAKRLAAETCHVRSDSKRHYPEFWRKKGAKKKRMFFPLCKSTEQPTIPIISRKKVESGILLLFREFNKCLMQHSLESAGFFPFPRLSNCSIISHITSNCWASTSNVALSIAANKNRKLENSAFHISTWGRGLSEISSQLPSWADAQGFDHLSFSLGSIICCTAFSRWCCKW